ncbi:putative gustatory receptor 39b [Eurosta solidaginis]|uniref:putative gustatory receptor 39b n=1 Tax=Eurosta solidaginis TaxID=178769 RepID=UPI0035312016
MLFLCYDLKFNTAEPESVITYRNFKGVNMELLNEEASCLDWSGCLSISNLDEKWRHSLPTLLLTYVATIKIFSFQVLTTLLILMEATNRRKQHAQFLLVLEEIEVALKLRLRLDVRKCELIKTLNYLIIYFVTLSLLGLALFIITSMWLNYIGFFWSSLWAIVTIRLRVIQLCLYVRTLEHYLEWLCAILPQIVAYHLAPQQQLLDIDYGQLGSVAYLLCIKEIYALISKAFHLLNYFCGWSLFGIFIFYILDIICNIT